MTFEQFKKKYEEKYIVHRDPTQKSFVIFGVHKGSGNDIYMTLIDNECVSCYSFRASPDDLADMIERYYTFVK